MKPQHTNTWLSIEIYEYAVPLSTYMKLQRMNEKKNEKRNNNNINATG